MNKVQQKVLDFASDPARTQPNAVFKLLSDNGFWERGEDDNDSTKLLQQILAQPDLPFCAEGIKKFQVFMGDLLKPTMRRVITLELSVPDDGRSEYPASAVVGDIRRHVVYTFASKHGNFYKDAKVNVIRDERRDR